MYGTPTFTWANTSLLEDDTEIQRILCSPKTLSSRQFAWISNSSSKYIHFPSAFALPQIVWVCHQQSLQKQQFQCKLCKFWICNFTSPAECRNYASLMKHIYCEAYACSEQAEFPMQRPQNGLAGSSFRSGFFLHSVFGKSFQIIWGKKGERGREIITICSQIILVA